MSDLVQGELEEKERYEAELKKSGERFRIISELISDYAFCHNVTPDGKIVLEWITDSFTRRHGYTVEEINSIGWPNLIYQEDLPVAFKQAERALSGQSDVSEFRFTNKDGEVRWIRNYVQPIWDNVERRVTRIYGATQDITERKMAEEERNQIEKELRLANSMKDEFLATISHELRTPLQSILGWAKLIRTEDLDKDTFNQAIDSIERNAQVQVRLIEDLLDVSHIITGKIQVDNRLVDLAPVIDAAINTIRTAADAKKITVQFFLESGVGPVFGDTARLQQVVWNLLSNAVKFTPVGGHVEVWLKKDNSQVQIKVKDTGQGIDPAFLPFMFDKFRQADSTTTRKHSGLGLGLAIVRYFVELHGGTVRAESPGKGEGSTFTVLLPVAK